MSLDPTINDASYAYEYKQVALTIADSLSANKFVKFIEDQHALGWEYVSTGMGTVLFRKLKV